MALISALAGVLGGTLASTGTAIGGTLGGALGSVGAGITGAGTALTSATSAVGSGLGSVASAVLPEAVVAAGEGIGSAVGSTLGGVGETIASALPEGVVAAGESVGSALGSVGETIGGLLPESIPTSIPELLGTSTSETGLTNLLSEVGLDSASNVVGGIGDLAALPGEYLGTGLDYLAKGANTGLESVGLDVPLNAIGEGAQSVVNPILDGVDTLLGEQPLLGADPSVGQFAQRGLYDVAKGASDIVVSPLEQVSKLGSNLTTGVGRTELIGNTASKYSRNAIDDAIEQKQQADAMNYQRQARERAERAAEMRRQHARIQQMNMGLV